MYKGGDTERDEEKPASSYPVEKPSRSEIMWHKGRIMHANYYFNGPEPQLTVKSGLSASFSTFYSHLCSMLIFCTNWRTWSKLAIIFITLVTGLKMLQLKWRLRF